jgi:enolase
VSDPHSVRRQPWRHGRRWKSWFPHRSGETVDSFIADFTVALGTDHLKTGAPCRGERVEKPPVFGELDEVVQVVLVYAK